MQKPGGGGEREPGGTLPVNSQIDYLAKDFRSFKRLMFDRLSARMPNWQERNPADLGVTLVELLSYAADQLSYYQDAVATEAYLGTARRRESVRRHARLLGYAMHDGANARAFVSLEVDGSADGQVVPRGTALLTRVGALPAQLPVSQIEPARVSGAQVFETMHDVTLRSAHSRMDLVAGDDPILRRGATSAILRSHEPTKVLTLQVGEVVFLEEEPPPGSDLPADPTHRHAVRLRQVELGRLGPATVVVTWDDQDALPFDLPIAHGAAHGNVVLVDHGYTLPQPEPLPAIPAEGSYRPILQQEPVTQQGAILRGGTRLTFDPQDSAASALRCDLREVRPVVTLLDASGTVWTVRRDLIGCDHQIAAFVSEVTDDGRAVLRFGDGQQGKRPDEPLRANYRIGNGRRGNVGAEAIAHLIYPLGGLLRARNPLPAQGGTDPESVQQVRTLAPHAFRTQERAVTVDDYAAIARRHPQVVDAQATRRFTGSFYTIVVTVQRRGGLPLDDSGRAQLRAFLDRYRMVGHDLQIASPVYVPLSIKLEVQVAASHFRSVVQDALGEALGDTVSAAGVPGFFHPDNLALGQPLFQAQLLRAVWLLPGVERVAVTRFQRYGALAADENEAGVIRLLPTELPQLDNDPSAPQRGQLEIVVRGGR